MKDESKVKRSKLMKMDIQYFADSGKSKDSGENNDGGDNKEGAGKDDVSVVDNKDANGGLKNDERIAEEAKKMGVSEFLKKLGVDTEEGLQSIVQKHKEDEEKNLTDIQKVTRERDTAIKKCAEEREARILAEAQLEALKLGAKVELVEDLVIIAKSKVSGDKTVKEVLEDMKKGDSGKVYFETDEKDNHDDQQTKRKTTRSDDLNNREDDTKRKGKNEGDGSIASRLLASRKKSVKSSYWD